MRLSIPLVVLAALLGTQPLQAQVTTEDGIRALLRGDAAAAARILRPLAEEPQHPDPVAQFFLALLYDSGHGVSHDDARACGLFLAAGSAPGPFADQAWAIADTLRAQFGGGASLLCVAHETWQGGAPQVFVLGPRHRIVFADTSVTVTDGDREQRQTILLGVGVEFLPIQYTPIVVTQPQKLRRDFFQWFQWTPDSTITPTSWTLSWMLSEVVDDQWQVIGGDRNLAVVHGPAPPASFDTASVVRVGVSANGDVSFSILGGPSARTEIVPPRRRR